MSLSRVINCKSTNYYLSSTIVLVFFMYLKDFLHQLQRGHSAVSQFSASAQAYSAPRGDGVGIHYPRLTSGVTEMSSLRDYDAAGYVLVGNLAKNAIIDRGTYLWHAVTHFPSYHLLCGGGGRDAAEIAAKPPLRIGSGRICVLGSRRGCRVRRSTIFDRRENQNCAMHNSNTKMRHATAIHCFFATSFHI